MANDITQQVSQLLKAGRGADAARGIETLLKATPKSVPLWLLLAQVHGRGTRRYDLALKSAQRAIALAPKNHQGWLEAAQALDELELHPEAYEHIIKARKLAPKTPDVLYAHALILANLDRIVEAQKQLRTLLKAHPDHLKSRIQLAFLKIRGGEPDEARAMAQDIRENHPDNTLAYSALGAAGVWQAGDPALAYLENTLIPKAKADGSPDLPRLLNTLAKAKNDLKDYDAAITLWGAAKQAEGRSHDAARYAKFIDTLTRDISRGIYLGNPGVTDETPVLIVGMPRSGSTLLAQILSAHPQIASVGESPALRITAKRLGIGGQDAVQQVKAVKNMTAEAREQFAAHYLARLRRTAPDAKRIVDKRLHNFEYLTLLAATLPRARILHALRDPMDTCVSCYMQKLPIAHGYTGDLGQLGDYYTAYRRLMDHWAAALPNPMLDVQYEEVVADTETQARRIIDFLGLEWDPACLNYRDNATQVRTLSNWQVRQPIYTTSVQRWRRYDAHLGPLKSALSDFYPEGFDQSPAGTT